jgi:hypothetical protein
VLQDPLNAFLLRGARLLDSMGIFLPVTPRVPKLLRVHDLNSALALARMRYADAEQSERFDQPGWIRTTAQR